MCRKMANEHKEVAESLINIHAILYITIFIILTIGNWYDSQQQ